MAFFFFPFLLILSKRHHHHLKLFLGLAKRRFELGVPLQWQLGILGKNIVDLEKAETLGISL